MKFEITRRGIEIRPETIQDIAFIEDTLGLKNDYDAIALVRRNRLSTSTEIAELTTHPFPSAPINLIKKDS